MNATSCKPFCRTWSGYATGRRTEMTGIRYRTIDVDGLDVFYREAGPSGAAEAAPTTQLFQLEPHVPGLIPPVADCFHVIAPDLPGFGRTAMPRHNQFKLPVRPHRPGHGAVHRGRRLRATSGLRLRLRRTDGLPDRGAAPGPDHRDHFPERQRLRGGPERRLESHPRILAGPSPATGKQSEVRPFTPQATLWQYTHGVPDASVVFPDGYSLDSFYLAQAQCGRSPARPVPRLREQRGPVPGLPGPLP